MKLIKTINENVDSGAVAAGGVAAHATPLFANLVSRTKKPPKKRFKRLENKPPVTEDVKDDSRFDVSHVLAKLKSLENKEQADYRDTVTFGLEDDAGNLIRIVVKDEQADSFEQALQSYMSNHDEQEPRDVAEVLFSLKDHFDIVDITWPDVQEDEEEPDMDLDMSDEGGEGGDLDMVAGGDDNVEEIPGGAGTEEVESLLSQIIDMMKADAEARKAEAIAKSAEAKAKEAAAAHAQILAKVKQEEQFLDMESHSKKQKEADKEAKRLAQLARWKHEVENEDDMEGSYDTDSVSLEDEEYNRLTSPQKTKTQTPKKVLPADLARYLASRIK